jgi:hypothetical protein
MEQKMSLPKEVGTGDLAALIGISARNVGILTDKGVFRKLKHGTYNLRDSVQAHTLHREEVAAEKHAAGEHGQLQIETLREKLKILVLDREEREKALMPVDAVVDTLIKTTRIFRTAFLSLPTRWAARATNISEPGKLEAILRKDVEEALESFSNLWSIVGKEREEKEKEKRNAIQNQ